MRKDNSRIGFNDSLLMGIGIPAIALIVPVLFFARNLDRPPYLTINEYFVTLGITAIVWISNRYIMIYCRGRYPLFSEARKRIFFQSALMLVFTVVVNTVLGAVAKDFAADKHLLNKPDDSIIHSNFAAIFGIITMIAVYEGIFFKYQLRHSVEEGEKLKRERLNAELNALKAQVNPHFLFNNLNTLAAVIPEDPKLSVHFVHQLSKLYRYILEVKDEPAILLQDELDVLKAYTFLLQTRFGSNLSVVINVPTEKLCKKIVPLALQLLMENAVKHNIVSSARPLRVEVNTVNGKLVMSNNLQKKKQVNESTGIGLNNIRNRYKLLGNGQVEVSESGSDFTVSIPLIEN